MKHDAFDEALRRRAQREKSALSTQAEERVARAIREGQARAASHARAQGERDTAAFVWPGEERQAPHKPRRRITRLIPLITGAAACLTAAALWAARTPVDRVHESALTPAFRRIMRLLKPCFRLQTEQTARPPSRHRPRLPRCPSAVYGVPRPDSSTIRRISGW